MRRLIAGLSVVALMVVATSAMASVELESGSYKDVFPGTTYSGSAGSIPWENSPWKEIGDDGLPGEGAVHVDEDPYCPDYKCLHIFGQGETYSLVGVVRFADLSRFDEVDLCYDVKRFFDEGLKGSADAKLLVQVATDGSNWTTIDSFGLETTDSSPIHRSKGISNWIAERFAIRFVVTGTLGSEVFIDNVEIKGKFSPEPTTITTTTTKPTTTKPTTTKPTTTTTPQTTTTTTRHDESTTTTTGRSTTTTPSPTTTTTVIKFVVPPAVPPTGSGIRETDSGVQADFSSGLFGSMEMGQPEVLDVELTADYSMAVELIETTWVWMIGLLVIIAGAIATGLDRRRTLETPAAT
jgi:hypothetical protein